MVPINGDDVLLGTQPAATVNVQANFISAYSGAGLSLLKINASGITGNFVLSQSLGSSAMLVNTEIIGDTTGGNFYTQNAGSNAATNLILGNQSGGVGVYTLSGTGNIQAGTLLVGGTGKGTMNQSGGTVSVTSSLEVGQKSTVISAYNLSAGTINIGSGGSFSIGNRGEFNQTGGAMNFAGSGAFNIYAGTSSGNNTYTLSGGQLTGAVVESIGTSGSGPAATFIQSGGTNNLGSGGRLVVGDGADGLYTLSGAGQLNATNMVLGNNSGAWGEVNQSGGTATIVQELTLAGAVNSGGVYKLSGRHPGSTERGGGRAVSRHFQPVRGNSQYCGGETRPR